MHFSEGKHQLTKKVYVDDQDMEDLKYISSKGVHVYIQDVPGDSKNRNLEISRGEILCRLH